MAENKIDRNPELYAKYNRMQRMNSIPEMSTPADHDTLRAFANREGFYNPENPYEFDNGLRVYESATSIDGPQGRVVDRGYGNRIAQGEAVGYQPSYEEWRNDPSGRFGRVGKGVPDDVAIDYYYNNVYKAPAPNLDESRNVGYSKYKNDAEQWAPRRQTSVYEKPMNPEANAQAMRYGVDNKLAELEVTNPRQYRAIMQAMRKNPLEGGKLFGFSPMAAVPMAMAASGQDPLTNYVGAAGALGAGMANTIMDAGMVAQPFIDYAGYVQRPEFKDERWKQMQEMGE